jgi:hypothetical protein
VDWLQADPARRTINVDMDAVFSRVIDAWRDAGNAL